MSCKYRVFAARRHQQSLLVAVAYIDGTVIARCLNKIAFKAVTGFVAAIAFTYLNQKFCFRRVPYVFAVQRCCLDYN